MGQLSKENGDLRAALARVYPNVPELIGSAWVGESSKGTGKG